MIVGVARPRDLAFDLGSGSLYHCMAQKRTSPNFICLTFRKVYYYDGVSCYKAVDTSESFLTIVGTRFPPKSRLTNLIEVPLGDTDTAFLIIG